MSLNKYIATPKKITPKIQYALTTTCIPDLLVPRKRPHCIGLVLKLSIPTLTDNIYLIAKHSRTWKSSKSLKAILTSEYYFLWLLRFKAATVIPKRKEVAKEDTVNPSLSDKLFFPTNLLWEKAPLNTYVNGKEENTEKSCILLLSYFI